jgi:hypothetical protein
MAFDIELKITFQDEAGNYYVATQDYNGAWSVTTTPTLTYLKNSPINWDKDTVITWQRNMDYAGVFRSMTDKYVFGTDGRAILQSLMFGGGGVNAYCRMTIYRLNEATFTYDVLYPSEIDFTKYDDDAQSKRLNIGTIDNGLLKYWESKRDVKVNIPFWTYDGAAWSTDANAVLHDGVKVYWEGSWISAASATFPLVPATGGGLLYAWNRGSVSDSRHWIPVMKNINAVMNNGTTTYIGNDILQTYMPQTDQPYNYNRNFEGVNDIRAYTTSSCLFKDMLPNPTVSDVVDVELILTGKFNGTITYNNVISQDQFVAVVLFEIGEDDLPVMSGGNYQYTLLYSQNLPNGASPYTPPSSGIFTTTTSVSLNFKKAYVLGIIYDGVTTGLTGQVVNVSFSDLRLTAKSLYNSGSSTPVKAPSLPPSTLLAYTPMQVFQKVMAVLDSTQTDAYGFPVPTYNYSALSNFLTTLLDPANNFDLQPSSLWFTSENMVRNTAGISYMTISLTELFNVLNRVNLLGLGFHNDTTISMEYMTGYFDNTTELFDLGANISELQVKPYTSLMGNRIHGGYGEMQTNNDFGGDNYNFGQEYTLPLDTTPKVIDCSIDFIAEINQIEKMRQQSNNSNSPSSANNVVLLQVNPSSADVVTMYNPEGGSYFTTAVLLLKFANAQSTDPTAATDPYINGLKYPDTAYNLGITPAKNLLRMGAWFRTMCDGQDVAGKYITYKKQYQQIYGASTSPATSLPSISTKIYAALVNEVADIELNTLNDKIFRPYIYTFTTEYPLNMYTILNSNPYGYVSFTGDDGIARKGHLYRIQQSAGNNAATTMELLATADTTDSELRIN